MSDQDFCQDPSHKHGPKRCTTCGKLVKPASVNSEPEVSPESLAKFKSFIEDMLSEGEDLLQNKDTILEAAEDLEVPKSIAENVFIEYISGEGESSLELKLYYDTSVASMGVANGNSILSLKLENASPKSFEKILIEFKHPEEQTPIVFSPVKSLGKGKAKLVESSLKLNLVGQHSIRDGEIRVFALNGSVQVFRLASPIRMSAENSNAARANTNVVHQNIETHGGGVVDASRFGGGGVAGSAKLDVWESIRLKKVNAKEQGTMDSLSESKSIASAPVEQPVAEPVRAPEPEPIPELAPAPVVEPEVVAPEPVIEEPIAKSVETPARQPGEYTFTTESGEKKVLKTGFLDPGDDEHGGFREVSDFEFEDLSALENLKNDLLDDFVRLMSLMSDGQPNKLSVFYKPVDIDFPLLKSIASAASMKMTDVLAVAVPGSLGSDLKQLSGATTVVTRDGLLIFEGQGTKVDLKANYSWVFMDENGWGLFQQDFGAGYYIAMIGDESTDVSLPGMTFDLRKNEDKLGAIRLYSFAQDRFSQLMRAVSTIENFDDEEDEDEEEFSDSAYQYRVEISGVGSQVAMGAVARATYDYFKSQQIDINDYVNHPEKYSGMPHQFQFIENGEWYELQDLVDVYGVELSDSSQIQVFDAEGQEVWSSPLDTGLLVNAGVTINCLGEDYVDDEADGTVVFLGVEHQRGTFFVADLELEDSFDPARLRFDYHNANGWSVSQTLWYDGEAYEIDGPDTVNTSAQFSLTLVGEEAILAAEQAALAAQVAPVVEEEEEEPEEEDEVAQAAQRFFAMYAFVTQYCDEEADRPIHLYMDDEDDGGEVSRSLAEQLAPLFPNDLLLAICEEDPQSLHGANGELSGWNGLATVVTNSGLYHVKSNSSGAYELDGKTAYLSWAKLFGDCKANLMIRSEVPDIWLGTADAYLVKASYVDFSSSVSTWIYFDEFVKPELLERFNDFKQLVLSRA
jgi:hypothetical protein